MKKGNKAMNKIITIRKRRIPGIVHLFETADVHSKISANLRFCIRMEAEKMTIETKTPNPMLLCTRCFDLINHRINAAVISSSSGSRSSPS